MTKKLPKLPAAQYSACGALCLVPSWSQIDPTKVWWTLNILSPKTNTWVAVQGGTNAYWMTDLGFNPYATT